MRGQFSQKFAALDSSGEGKLHDGEIESGLVPDDAVTCNRDITLEIRIRGKVNFALAQNNIAVIEQVKVRNNTDRPLSDLQVGIKCHPPVFRKKTWNITSIMPGSTIDISDTKVSFDMQTIGGLDEAETGEIEFRAAADGIEPTVELRPIEVLARDEWGGLQDMAQILAAFVSPNDPVIAGILKEASRILVAAKHDGSLDGYQSKDPRRAYMLAASIWSAVTGMRLTYAEPPASFEQQGQKIRGPGRIKSEGLATCLDTTLLLAAAYEAAGLNSTIIFEKGHAWLGVWLVKKDFGNVTEPDVVAVRKAVQSHELVPVETTLVTQHPAVGFEIAVDYGRRRHHEDHDFDFALAVDVARSRAARIRPLATHRTSGGKDTTAEDETAPAPLPPPPDSNELPQEIGDDEDDTPLGRIERWQRKLLDLTLRNRLLNFRESKQSIPLLSTDINKLEDEFAKGTKFKGFSIVDNDPVGNRTMSEAEKQLAIESAIKDAFAKKQIAVPLTKHEMNTRLQKLYRKAKSDLDEGGANTLYLAVGFLKWKQNETDKRTYRAPLILMPAKLQRKSVLSPVILSRHEDEIRINSTLLEFLEKDFDIRIRVPDDELPEDESGIDVRRVLQYFRKPIRNIAGFEVVEEIALSTFSFAKYLMWKDLVDRTDQLKNNRLVKFLIEGAGETYGDPSDSSKVVSSDIDRRFKPCELLTPLPSDSSQLAAVLTAAQGGDFILIGPPGTGKSQTIANIIAQCLGNKKTILFVAEKAAALNVVHRRLVATGLGDAVLELHSNKSDRRSVLKQLGNGWNRVVNQSANNWIQLTENCRISRDKINAYVEALHKTGTQGFSVFDAIAVVADGKANFDISFGDSDNILSKDIHDEETFRYLTDTAAELGRIHAVAGKGPPLTIVDRDEWSYQWQNQFLSAIDLLIESLTELKYHGEAVAKALGLRHDAILSAKRREQLRALAQRTNPTALEIIEVPSLPSNELQKNMSEICNDFISLNSCKAKTKAKYNIASVRRIRLDKLDQDWREAKAQFWPLSAVSQRKVSKFLQSYAESGSADPEHDLPILFEMRDLDQTIQQNPLSNIAGGGSKGELQNLRQTVSQAIQFRQTANNLKPEIADASVFDSALTQLMSVSQSELHGKLKEHVNSEDSVKERISDFSKLGGSIPEDIDFAELVEHLRCTERESARFGDWARWVKAKKEGLAKGLGSLVDAIERGLVNGDTKIAFKKAYAAWWLPLAIDSDQHLRQFAHWDHEDTINKFRELDEKMLENAAAEVMRRIAHDLPAQDGVPRDSELGKLRHQLRLTRPSMPVRQLLTTIPESFGKLAPCVLMSPLSIAQYLPAGQREFDIVIFDEASQITTWDAIGAIARGRQTIIVGDAKQLPPTNFFGRVEDEDDELPDTEADMPSILDKVSSAGMPLRHLNWHYRSRYEALIAFSNRHYYDNRLITFPSPRINEDAVQLHKVDGTYARGRGRFNQQEAAAVVKTVVSWLREWAKLPENKRLTLGIITLNAEQQSLILDKLDSARRTDKQLEWFFSDDREEPVIVKNIENIQGDERDVMVLSITFGPDKDGKLTMNFGALNGTGGEKRLNVAITRARLGFHVFSSITSKDIDLSRTNARGVIDLKNFLDYAENGAIALSRSQEGSLGEAENPFEEAVADAIRSKGWEVRTQIGVAGYRVDLGVVHPLYAGNFIAGIECDGATYHSSATARDRDKSRQSVLEGLGWTILRVWSTDWFRDPKPIVERLHRTMTEILELDRAEHKETRESEPSKPRKPEESEPKGEDVNGKTAIPTVDGGRTSKPPPDPPDPERFFDDNYTEVLQQFILIDVSNDSPLPLALLIKRIAQLHGWKRAGRQIQQRVRDCLSVVDTFDENGTTFIWGKGQYSDRVPYRGIGNRQIREISRSEIASVIDENSESLVDSDDPIRTLAGSMEIKRLTSDTREYLQWCMDWHREEKSAKN